jgi:hypothetical protein
MSIRLLTMNWFGHSQWSTYRFSEVNALHWFWGSILRTNIKTQRTVPYALF